MTIFAYLFILGAAVFVVVVFILFFRFQNSEAAIAQSRRRKRGS